MDNNWVNTINVYEITGYCAVTVGDGRDVYARLSQAIQARHWVILDFKCVTRFAPCFWRELADCALMDFSLETLSCLIKQVNLSMDGWKMAQKAIKEASKKLDANQSPTK